MISPVLGVTPAPYCGPVDHYANAVRAEPGQCWRMMSCPPGHQAGSPTDCREPVRWVGRRQVGKKRMRLWSCEGHAEGLEDAKPIDLSDALGVLVADHGDAGRDCATGDHAIETECCTVS